MVIKHPKHPSCALLAIDHNHWGLWPNWDVQTLFESWWGQTETCPFGSWWFSQTRIVFQKRDCKKDWNILKPPENLRVQPPTRSKISKPSGKGHCSGFPAWGEAAFGLWSAWSFCLILRAQPLCPHKAAHRLHMVGQQTALQTQYFKKILRPLVSCKTKGWGGA